jgi:hypothetical protein
MSFRYISIFEASSFPDAKLTAAALKSCLSTKLGLKSAIEAESIKCKAKCLIGTGNFYSLALILKIKQMMCFELNLSHAIFCC